MPNPMGGMGGPKPCMMGPHMGPRMMHGPNLNTMNGEQNSCYNCVIDKYDIFDVNMFKLFCNTCIIIYRSFSHKKFFIPAS